MVFTCTESCADPASSRAPVAAERECARPCALDPHAARALAHRLLSASAGQPSGTGTSPAGRSAGSGSETGVATTLPGDGVGEVVGWLLGWPRSLGR